MATVPSALKVYAEHKLGESRNSSELFITPESVKPMDDNSGILRLRVLLLYVTVKSSWPFAID